MTGTGEAASARRERLLVVAMFLAGAAVYLQAYDAQAVLPAIAADEGVGATASVLVLSATTVGMAAGVLPWAYVSDRAGRLRIIRWCLIAATVVSLVTPFVPGFGALLVLRVLKGVLLGGVTGLAVAFLFERIRPARAVIASGVYISGNTVGGVVTRVLSGLLADASSWRIALGTVAALGAVLTIAFLIVTRGLSDETRPAAPRLGGARVRRVSLGRRLRQSGVLLCFAQGFVTLGVFNALFSVLPFELQADHPEIGQVLSSAVLGLYAVAFVSAQSGGRLSARFGLGRPLAAGYVLAFGGLAMLFLPGMLPLTLGVAALVLGIFLVHPLSSAESGRRMPTHRAQSTALYQISWLAGATIVGPIASAFFERHGWEPTLLLLAGVLAVGAAAGIVDARESAVGRSAEA